MLDDTAYNERDKYKMIMFATVDAPPPRSLPRPPKLPQIREEHTLGAAPGLEILFACVYDNWSGV